MDYYIYAALGAMLITLLVKTVSLFWGSEVKKRPPGLPGMGYKLVYSDEKEGRRVEGVEYSKVLMSGKYGLRGKPDFIYERRGRPVLVELKSGLGGDCPHKGDLMQLAAYFLIAEEHYGIRPRQGRLIYKDSMFVVKNTARLRREVISVTKDMRRMLKDGEGEPGQSFAKCRHCMCRGTVCEFCDD